MPADEKARLWRERAGEITVLLGLGALAVTPDLSFGHHALLHAPIPVLDRAFSVVRASGRAIWVVDYALIILSIGFLRDRIAPRIFVPFLVCIVWLQWIDTAPLRAAARGYFAGAGQSAPALRLPPRLRLFSVIPFCGPEEVVADQYRLLALRAGADLVRTREAHPATDAQCAAALASGLTEPLAPGEARLFLPSVRASLHPAQLGAAAQCGGQPVGLLCYAPAGR
jgi:hypothetical protein